MASTVAAVISRLQEALVLHDDYEGISPTPLPDKALFPYITVVEIDDGELETFDGPSGVGPKIIQVNCFHKVLEEASNLRDKVKTALLNTANSVQKGLIIQGVNYRHGAALYNPQIEKHQYVCRFTVWIATS